MAASMLNFNVGVLGHIDSGKTSLAKALSTTASTAAFDKNPQSKERGITLDLGFSSFVVDIPEHLKDGNHSKLQFTLVDCPGHASLIKTIIGGAQIIDLMMLVIDVTKGMQTQSAEVKMKDHKVIGLCAYVIGEIACKKMLVVLNKVDLLQPEKKQQQIDKMTKRMLKTLENTCFANSPVIPVAAKPGGPDAPEVNAEGVETLIEELKRHAYLPARDSTGQLLFSVDHCFGIKGQGTVMTGTMLRGRVAVNDTVEIPSMQITRKVKSMQMFRQPVESAIMGDRVGICVTQFDPKLLERGLVCTPGSLPTIEAAVISVTKIGYFRGPCATKAKFHVTMGHETVMARVTFFGDVPGQSYPEREKIAFSFDKEYLYQDDLKAPVKSKGSSNKENQPEEDALPSNTLQWALLEFEKPITCPVNCLWRVGRDGTREMAWGTIKPIYRNTTDKEYVASYLPSLKIYKTKTREGVVDRMTDEYSIIGRGLFKKETNLQTFVGLKVKLSTGEAGVIEGGFGQSGKFKIRIPNGLNADTSTQLSSSSKKKGKKAQKDDAAVPDPPAQTHQQPIKIHLQFKRYIYDSKKQIIQT
ncbi:putative selenocysteine-specific elongation factor [Apostichopus japonicus]|uniref:Selenocysteine-specific elongation factor n=1 Tax=Stichopus japonicus TaxID=307972 RepID=A0A2G8L1R2_STIJA|nr:putative selenocysteine-specific elongation factor [Apostichopus japonicus]